MEFLVEWAFGALIVVVGPLLTLLDLPGNTIMLAAGMVISLFYSEKIVVVSENIQFCEHYALVYSRCI